VQGGITGKEVTGFRYQNGEVSKRTPVSGKLKIKSSLHSKVWFENSCQIFPIQNSLEQGKFYNIAFQILFRIVSELFIGRHKGLTPFIYEIMVDILACTLFFQLFFCVEKPFLEANLLILTYRRDYVSKIGVRIAQWHRAELWAGCSGVRVPEGLGIFSSPPHPPSFLSNVCQGPFPWG
jgi:hypothetical protein